MLSLPIPRSWHWKELKLTITLILCCLPSFFFLLIDFKPLSLNLIYSRFFFEFLLEKPDLLSQLRPLGLDLFNTQLRDYSLSYHQYEKEKFRREFRYLESFRRTRKTRTEQISYDVMEYFVREYLQREYDDPFEYHHYLINQFMGAQSDIISFISKYHRIENLKEAEAYLIRVQRISIAFDQLIEQQIERRRRKIETPRFVLKRVIDELDSFQKQLQAEPNRCPLVVAFLDKLGAIQCSSDQRTDLLSRLLKILRTDVNAAYDRLLAVLHDDLAEAVTDHGVWKLPNGDRYYQLCLEFHTTTKMTAKEIFDMGCKHVERIQNEMRNILKENRIANWEDFRGSITNFDSLADQKYPNVEESRQMIIDDYRRIIDEIDNEMHRYFSPACRPTAKCNVERIPPFKEATAPAAYYFPPSLDGKSAGTFFANLRDINEVVKFKMASLAYHEAVPGHHFQFTIAQSLKHLPFFRRLIPFTAYMEGWALYTEQLAAEQGFHKSWHSYLGYLDYQLLRSCRLVVDSGIHWKRWTREEAIDYMVNNTCMKREEAITEVERYFVCPGQACSYMVGCQTILSLREKAQSALGERFNLKDFHDAVLLNGSLPLNILEDVIDDYIQEKSR